MLNCPWFGQIKKGAHVLFANYSVADIITNYGLENPDDKYVNICYAKLNTLS